MLHVHRSERADQLVAGLADILREPPADPFTVEVVAVPAKGVERWLTQRLSHRLGVDSTASAGDGVCANVRFPSPAALVSDAIAAASGVDPGDDPWHRGRMLWVLLDVIDSCVTEDWCSTLARHLGVSGYGGQHRRGRRLGAAAHLAALFDSYGEHRPRMLQGWADGRDTDGAGAALGADLAWQAELWRRLRTRLGMPSPAERLAEVSAALRRQPEIVDLPGRLSVFGPTRLTTAQLDVLAALADRRDVHLWLPHPSGTLWQRVAPEALAAGHCRRRLDPTADLPQHRLLASLGRDARELQLQLAACGVEQRAHHHPVDDRPATLLGLLQRAVQDDAPPGPEPRPPLRQGDRSIQVHACHGAARQVEVLRDVLLTLLADDPTLEPRDVLVMCPDIEDYAPLVSATFGVEDDDVQEQHPGHRLRVRLADRSLRQTNPLLATLATLLELADGRVTASQVLDLAASQPVRRRFRFSDSDIEVLRAWVPTSGVRWGLDAAHRSPFGLQHIRQNTWRAGLDRILLGAAMAEDEHRWVGLALPLDDVDSTAVDLAGRLAELVDRLAAVLDDLTGEHPLAHWLAVLGRALDTLAAVRDEEAWQSTHARRELAEVARDAGPLAGQLQLSLDDVRALLAQRLQGRPTRANFRTGTLTMCSMVPMRSVPHRVICLLGLDDGRFPRSSGVDGDDVLARDPCIGERDPRSEDRQLLLDAVLAAREHLVVLYTGADPRTNAHRPPAVPVGEILDAVDGTVRSFDGRRPRDHVVVQHPLQPFDPRNFTDGALGTAGPFSFDVQALRGAARAVHERQDPAPFLAAPLAPLHDDADLALDDLVAFLEHPARGFLRQRLDVALVRDEEEIADALSVDLDPLQQWEIGDRLLQLRLSGADPDTCQEVEWRRGALPPGELGKRMIGTLMQDVEPLVTASAPHRSPERRALDVSVRLDGRRLAGTVSDVYGDTVTRAVYSRLGAKHRVRAWTLLLSLSAAFPETSWRAVSIGRARSGPGVLRSTLGPVAPDEARQLLRMLVDLRSRGLRAPLPMAVQTSSTYAVKRRTGVSHDSACALARKDWARESDDPAHELIWGRRAELSALLAQPAAGDEQGPGWPADEPTRFGALACRLWGPLLDAEQQERL